MNDVEEDKSSKRKRNDVEEEDKSKIIDVEEEDKSSKRRKSIEFGECFLVEEDEAKEIEFGDTDNLTQEELSRNEFSDSEFGDTDSCSEDELEAAFIQFGDTDDLSDLLLGIVEDKSSLVAKCFPDKTQEDNEAKEPIIRIGDTVNLSDLLFTEYRDYLITCNHHDPDKLVKVKSKDLAGKFIVLHFVYLKDSIYSWSWKAPIANLEDMYTKLHPKGDFEIVFLGLRDDRDNPSIIRGFLRDLFYIMPPCPAIPLADQKSIRHLERIFGVNNREHVGPSSFIIDPTGDGVMHPPFDKDRSADKFMYCVFGNKCECGLLAFDANGSVVRVRTFPQLGDKESFPFYHNMENEVLLEVKEKIAYRTTIVQRSTEFGTLDLVAANTFWFPRQSYLALPSTASPKAPSSVTDAAIRYDFAHVLSEHLACGEAVSHCPLLFTVQLGLEKMSFGFPKQYLEIQRTIQ
ncbi:hypothetical protein POM88_043179 [Heracleum sosnowskyi]|uniref:Uncharacterized protein n=1 Tax=Heracleum sosnowskyi TaxID=360622 RepID=A0AAD8H2Z9_9APIA|nr:hypothetical protein POM88_043179 [Heracleum sosnowskyi]